jgi:hypothetical protein
MGEQPLVPSNRDVEEKMVNIITVPQEKSREILNFAVICMGSNPRQVYFPLLFLIK